MAMGASSSPGSDSAAFSPALFGVDVEELDCFSIGLGSVDEAADEDDGGGIASTDGAAAASGFGDINKGISS